MLFSLDLERRESQRGEGEKQSLEGKAERQCLGPENQEQKAECGCYRVERACRQQPYHRNPALGEGCTQGSQWTRLWPPCSKLHNAVLLSIVFMSMYGKNHHNIVT